MPSMAKFSIFFGENFETRKYTDEQRRLFEDYLDALARVQGGRENSQSHASKYRNGKSNSLSGCNSSLKAAMDELQSLATRLAAEFGYKASSLKWTVRYEYDKSFNEVRVNFN